MEVTLKLSKGALTIREANLIDVARLVSAAFGFHDVDVEPMGPGKARATASGKDVKLVVHGSSVEDACDRLVETLCEKL